MNSSLRGNRLANRLPMNRGKVMTADDVVAVDSPLFLLMSPTPCWKCNADNLVIALASKRVRCSDPYANEGDVPILLSNIEKMPKEIADYLTAYHPPFQKRHSKMAESD